MRDDENYPGQPEFWKEESYDDRTELRKFAVKWTLVFGGLLFAMILILWWASAALNYSASRVSGTTKASYVVSGVVRDSLSGLPVPFAQVEDDPVGRPPLFHTTSDLRGAYTLMTLAEPHVIWVSALGHKKVDLRVGKTWFTWFPYGSEKLDIALSPE